MRTTHYTPGFGEAMAIGGAILAILVLILLSIVGSCSGWWVLISCEASLWLLFFSGLGLGRLGWKILRDGHKPCEEILQAPRKGVRNPQRL